MRRRFPRIVALYVAVCCAAIVVIVLRGDGPHPRIVSLLPANGDRFFPGGPAQITFSQSMDQSSVERALQVTPGSQGQGAWFGNTLNLQPVGDWRAGVTYHVSLTGSVVDDQGRPLPTPFSFWFRVHHLGQLTLCSVRRIRNVCERVGGWERPVTTSPVSVRSFALSPDGTLLAYIRPDATGLPHLFLMDVDAMHSQQLTGGRAYADSDPSWTSGDNSDITYRRRPVWRQDGRTRLGRARVWSVQIDGTGNAPF